MTSVSMDGRRILDGGLLIPDQSLTRDRHLDHGEFDLLHDTPFRVVFQRRCTKNCAVEVHLAENLDTQRVGRSSWLLRGAA